jgi:integrase
MATLRDRDGVAAMALELLILTAARTEAVRGACWSEIDLNKRLWTVPAARMKMKKEFTIPLQPRAVELLVELGKAKTGELVFPGAKAGEGLSDAAMLAVVKRMNAKRMAETGEQWVDATSGKPVLPHGFRSTFRDWAGEQTTFAREVIEAGMAHQLKDKAEAAYARGTMPERRRKLMDAWAQYCDRVIVPTDNVVQMRANA